MNNHIRLTILICGLFIAFLFFTSLFATDMVSLNFDNVDLKTIIKYMSELTGKNFIIPVEMDGRVTIISPTSVTVEEAYKVLESVLIVNGYTTVPEEDVVKIIPLNDAKKYNIKTNVGKEVSPLKEHDRMITQIIPLEYADVKKVKEIVEPYISDTGNLASYEPTNTLIVTDTSSNIAKLLEIIKDLDREEVKGPNDVHVYRVQYSDAVALGKLLRKVYMEANKDKEEIPVIVPDEDGNLLIIVASPQEYAFMERVLKKLDKPKKQIMVETIIAEVNMNKLSEFGLEFVAAGGVVYGGSEGLVGVDTKGPVRHILSGGQLTGTRLGAVEGTNQRGDVTMPNLGLLIKASKETDDVNIISAPKLLTSDNQEAQILVGKKLAFIKNIQVTPEGSTVRTFEYKDIGLLLKITPHITDDGQIRLEILQQVEDVIGQSFEGAVETSKREVKTVVTVKDNSTVVIGGLLSDKTKQDIQKVPLLGDIPVVNLLFKRTSTTREKMNLFLFITPHIVFDRMDQSQSLPREVRPKTKV